MFGCSDAWLDCAFCGNEFATGVSLRFVPMARSVVFSFLIDRDFLLPEDGGDLCSGERIL
jgi:hypothetical protein